MKKLLRCWKNYSTCEDCAFHLHRDVINTILLITYWFARPVINETLNALVRYIINPTLDPYQYWWFWSYKIVWAWSMMDHVNILLLPGNPPVMLCIKMFWTVIIDGEEEANRLHFQWCWTSKEDHLYHIRDNTLFQRLREAKDETEKREKEETEKREKEKTEKRKREETEKQETDKKKAEDVKAHEDQQNVVHVPKVLEKEEDLQKSLGEYTEKHKKWEKMFEDWSRLKANEVAKLVSEETDAKEQQSSLSRHRERVRGEIARLELESKDLANKIVDSETNTNKLVKKRHEMEACTDEKLYQQKMEKARLLDSIQKIKLELMRAHAYDAKEMHAQTDDKIDKIDLKVERTHQLAKEIEEKERDLECPVCFEVCTKPIFMCDLSHQICKQCRPKMKVCPQCREQYKKYKKRNTVQEMTSDQLQTLYMEMKSILESD